MLHRGCTLTHVAADGKCLGCVALSDTLREESAGMMKQSSRSLQIDPVLLTGDNQNAADSITQRLGISMVHARCLPEDKMRCIDEYQQSGRPVCMMGDGVNDAPALRRAMVGIAMGGVGSDIAVDAADIALVDDEVRELPHLVALSRRMMGTIRLQPHFFDGTQFSGHCPGHHRGVKPRFRRPGTQCGLGGWSSSIPRCC